MNSDEYARFTRPHQRILRQLCLELEFFLADVGPVNVFSVESRIKGFASAASKSRRMSMPIEKLQDVAGLRVVVATRPEVEVVKRFFQRRADISKDIQIVKEVEIARPTGYRSTHLIAKFTGHYSRSAHDGNLEVQIPTIFEHAFNFVSHAWIYKSTTEYDDEWKRRFREMSVKLASIDDEATALHHDAVDESRIDPNRERLSPMLFCRLVREEFQEDVTMSDAVDYVHYYADMGVETVGQLQQFFRNSEVQGLWREFMETQHPSGKKSYAGRKTSFWSIFGTRLEFARTYLDEVKSKKE